MGELGESLRLADREVRARRSRLCAARVLRDCCSLFVVGHVRVRMRAHTTLPLFARTHATHAHNDARINCHTHTHEYTHTGRATRRTW